MDSEISAFLALYLVAGLVMTGVCMALTLYLVAGLVIVEMTAMSLEVAAGLVMAYNCLLLVLYVVTGLLVVEMTEMLVPYMVFRLGFYCRLMNSSVITF